MLKHFIKYLIFFGATLMNPVIAHSEPKPSEISAYDFTLDSLDGKQMPLSAFKGKVMLVVNTASKCGFTGQYKGLQELYDKYKDKGLVVIGVPSNDFGDQEPGNEAEIKNFCQLNYGVTFPMTRKQVVSGKDASPFYKWLHSVLGTGSAPKWNFHKYLIDAQGKPVDFYLSTTAPDSGKLIGEIERLLAGNS
jgi:glutathione peroxidase